MSNVSRTFYIKIEGFGELSSGSGTGELYRFTTRAVDADDVPILLDVPGRLSSSIQPLRPLGSDASVTFKLAYEASGHADKVRPLVADQEKNRYIYGGGTLVQLTKGLRPGDTSLNLTTTTGLSTGTLYYLGGEAITFSAFPSGTTATAVRGELSLYNGMYHTADEGLGPALTADLPSPVGLLVEYGYVGGGEPLFTGRIREVKLVDGVQIEISTVAVSSIAREQEFVPPQGPLQDLFKADISPFLAEVVDISDVLLESGKYGPDSEFTDFSGTGYIHFIHEDGRFATFSHSGFSVVSGTNYLRVNVDNGNSLAMVGDKNGLIYINRITRTKFKERRFRDTRVTRREQGVRWGAYQFARDLFEDSSKAVRRKMRFELAVYGFDLEDCILRLLSNPQINVAGMSAQIPSQLVNASIESSARTVTNTLSYRANSAFIMPPTDAKKEAPYVFRQRRKTILNTLKDTLSVFSLSLAGKTNGEINLIDWTTYNTTSNPAISSNDLASISYSMTVEENKSAPVVALVPPTPDFANESSDDVLYDINVDTQLIKSTRPVTSAQIRATEVIETKYAVGTIDIMENVARPQTEARVDVYGIPRPEIVFSVHSTNPTSQIGGIEPGDSFKLSHPDMPTASGARGMTQDALCVATEVSKDTASGTITIKALIIDRESVQRAKWAPAGVVTGIVGLVVRIATNVFTDADAGVGPTTDAEAFELDLPSAGQILRSDGASKVGCVIASRSGDFLTLSSATGKFAIGDIITLHRWDNTSGEWASFTDPPAYGADTADTLGSSNDDGQLYS